VFLTKAKKPLLFCIIILVAYLVGLWGTSVPLTGDQKVYLSIALEMMEKKQWIIPSLFSEPNFLKPPFQYWTTIIGWKTFGFNLFGALIPSVLALVTSSFLVFKIGEKIKLKKPALAAVLFASTIGSITYGATAQMEIWIVLFLLSSWLAVLSRRIFLAFVLVGIMAWVKGPLYPVLWTMSILVWNLSFIKSKKFWAALFLGGMIGLSWYFLAARTHQREMMNQFFYSENFGKAGTQHGSIFGLWSEFLFSLLPWGVFLFFGFFQKSVRESWRENQKFYLSYSLVSVIFFTFFPYHVNSYLYFLTPIMAMMASEIDLPLSPRSKALGMGIYLVFFLLMNLVYFQLFKGGWVGVEIFSSIVFASIVFFGGYLKSHWEFVSLGSLLIVNIFRVSAVQIGERDIAGLKEVVLQRPGEYAYYIDSKDMWHEYGLISAAIGQSVQRIYDKTKIDSFLAAGGTIILQEDQQVDFPHNINCIEWQRLKRRTKFPIQKFLINGIVWGSPEIMRKFKICTAVQ